MEPSFLLADTKIWFEALPDHYKVHINLRWFKEPSEKWVRLLEIRTALNEVQEYEMEFKGRRVDYKVITCKRTELKSGTTSYEVDFEVASHPLQLCFSAFVSPASSSPAIKIYQGYPISELLKVRVSLLYYKRWDFEITSSRFLERKHLIPPRDGCIHFRLY